MILIADSGSTKTDWCVVDNGKVVAEILTKGTNPFFQTEAEIASEIETALLGELPATSFESVCFYGAGCGFPDKIELVKRALGRFLNVEKEIAVHTDMLAAAHALCGHRPGIACILGTGSNSCYYDGNRIVANVSPLGFILGDEGSGACLGKLMLGDLLKNQMPASVREDFFGTYRLDLGEIIDRVYRKPFPNRFLAGFSPFIRKHIDEPCVYRMVCDSFKAFLERNVMQYDYREQEVHFVGSVAYHYREVLEAVCAGLGIRCGKIEKSPMKGLIDYHSEL